MRNDVTLGLFFFEVTIAVVVEALLGEENSLRPCFEVECLYLVYYLGHFTAISTYILHGSSAYRTRNPREVFGSVVALL